MNQENSNALESKTTPTSMSWGWRLFLGTILTILGFFSLSAPVLLSASAALMIGWLLIFGGIAQMIAIFIDQDKKRNIAINAMIGVIYLIFGIILANGSLYGNLLTITLFLAIFFLIDGIFKMILSFQLREEKNWGFLLAGSIISIVFAIIILLNIYTSSLILIGLLIGIEFIFMGISMFFDGFEQKKQLQPKPESEESGENILLIIVLIALLAFISIGIFR